MSAHAPASVRDATRLWTTWAPVAGLVVLAATWGRELPTALLLVVAAALVGSVLAAVHHAEVVAAKVGEPFGSLILAVAVTVIEVGLILILMSAGGDGASTLARDTVFAAAMITINGIMGISLLVAARRDEHGYAYFNPEGTGAALATVTSLAVLCLVVPKFATSAQGPQFSGPQLAFVALASLLLYGGYVFTQTVRHRDFFLPVAADGTLLDEDSHADPPSRPVALLSLGLLLVALVAVVGLAKVGSPAIESAVSAAGLPQSFVGVVIALLVLAPETIAARNAAKRGRLQVSLNLALGSALASIGLTLSVLAIASIWITTPLHLGLDAVQIVLLGLTVVVSVLTVVPGRATRLQGVVHLVLFAAFVFLAIAP